MSRKSAPKRNNITGRDGYIALQALAYAIDRASAGALAGMEQQRGHEEVYSLRIGQHEADYLRKGARGHIEGRGYEVKNGKLNLMPRKNDNVVSLC